MTLTVGSLFSGIGGIDLGLQMAGVFETRWFCEIDPYCQKVLAKHWPGVPVYGDVRELRGDTIEPVDVLVGGFPCQPVSTAGRRKGAADERWLWGEFVRLIREIRPRWVLAENVTGLRSIDDGRLFGAVLRDLAESGYDAEWDCIPASAVSAPHQRDRIWIVAYPASIRRAGWEADQRGREYDTVGRGEQPCRDGADGHVADTSRIPEREPADETDAFATGGQAWSIFGGRSSCVKRSRFWDVEPPIQRVLDGVSPRLVEDRLRAIGNAVVPQVVEHIGRRIMDVAR